MEKIIAEAKIRKLEADYLEVAKDGSAVAIQAVRDFFRTARESIRWVKQARRDAEQSHLQSLLDFARRAYRRPLSPADQSDLLSFYREARERYGLDHEGAIRDSIVLVLTSPKFSYRIDLVEPRDGVQPVSDFDLAARLSYFLWSTMPDEELLRQAAAGNLRSSPRKTSDSARLLRDAGVKVIFANVLMQQNADHYKQVQALAAEMGIRYEVDATITPMMDGDRGIVALNMDGGRLAAIMHDTTLLGDQAERLLAAPSGPNPLDEAYKTLPCSAGHTACYVSPYGDVFPCVQFPYKVGNVREQAFIDIWKHSPQLNEVRAIRVSDLEGCSSCVHGSSCARCPGLAYLEGNMRGPSIQDCEKSFARTGVPSYNLLRKQGAAASPQPAPTPPAPLPAQTEHPVVWMERR